MDRCHQARVRNALEPEWEARFEPRSYGFRPGRGCHDAIEAIYARLQGPRAKRAWILDADLAAAFDKIDHSRLLAALGSFPGQGHDRGLAEGGSVRGGQGVRADRGGNSPGRRDFTVPAERRACTGWRRPPESATAPPELMPVKRSRTPRSWSGTPTTSRCSATARSRPSRSKRGSPSGWRPRGLSFNEDKTRIVHLTEGFDFLGASVRRYPGGKLLIKPSKAAIRRLRERLAAETRALRGANAMAVIARLTPIIRGSPRVPSPLYDVAPDPSRRALATRLRGCGAPCRCRSDACCRRTGRFVQHLWCDYPILINR